MRNIYIYGLEAIFSNNLPKKRPKNEFLCADFWSARREKAIKPIFWAVFGVRKGMGGMVIGCWEKSNFLGS